MIAMSSPAKTSPIMMPIQIYRRISKPPPSFQNGSSLPIFEVVLATLDPLKIAAILGFFRASSHDDDLGGIDTKRGAGTVCGAGAGLLPLD